MNADDLERLERWVGAYRRLMAGGSISEDVHTACVTEFSVELPHETVFPVLRIGDVEALVQLAKEAQS